MFENFSTAGLQALSDIYRQYPPRDEAQIRTRAMVDAELAQRLRETA